jgi:hypothetical protein
MVSLNSNPVTYLQHRFTQTFVDTFEEMKDEMYS